MGHDKHGANTMSTVAFKDGIMACDSMMCFDGDEKQLGLCKIGRTKNYLFGYVGRLSQMFPLFDWVLLHEGLKEWRSPEDSYKFRDNLQTSGDDVGAALLANEYGQLWTVTTEGFCVPMPSRQYAVGSGCEYALGAMHAGATASDAVAAANEYDVSSGGFVHSIRFDPSDDLIKRPHVIMP